MPTKTKQQEKRSSPAGNQQAVEGLQPADCEVDELKSADATQEGGQTSDGSNDLPVTQQIPEWAVDPPGHIPREISEVRLVRKQGQVVEGLIQEIRRRNLRVKKGSSATGAGVVGDKHPDAIRLLLDGVASGHVLVDLDGIQQEQQG